MNDNTTYSFTRAELVAAFTEWEKCARSGGTLSPEDARALPLDESAERSADALIEYLTQS